MFTSLHNAFKTVIYFLTIFASIQALASPITPEEALSNVQEYLYAEGGYKLKGAASQSLSLAYAIGKNTTGEMFHAKAMGEAEKALVYIFNYGENEGFVVASGDDVAEPILGISDEGNFDVDNIPVNLAELLDEYANEIAWASITLQGSEILEDSSPNQAGASRKNIKVLLTTKWGQGSPYNSKCKFGKKKTACVTGCVATAMAQLAYYWARSSSTGRFKGGSVALGKYTTYTKKYEVPALPALTTFNWSKMVQKKGKPKNKKSKAAVATLMRYCGQSVRMDYTPSSSAASLNDAAFALRYDFRFDCDLSVAYADNMTSAEFENLIYSELLSKRPVIMAGSKSNYKGGHAFICDGYNSKKKKFHMNWGWNGSCNGYYKLSALKPVKNHNYSSHKMAIVGVDPLARTRTNAPSLEENDFNDEDMDETVVPSINEVTGIEEVATPETLDGVIIYNLNGQLVDNPSNGIYIVNGKKVLFK